VGYKIQAENLPLTPGFSETSKTLGYDPRELSLTGGEDYELVFTVPGGKEEALLSSYQHAAGDLGCAITKIGEITADSQERIVVDKNGKMLNFKIGGFDHFA
jgi:thiamine-monophosphate kinase